jgi:hypothetical protein
MRIAAKLIAKMPRKIQAFRCLKVPAEGKRGIPKRTIVRNPFRTPRRARRIREGLPFSAIFSSRYYSTYFEYSSIPFK